MEFNSLESAMNYIKNQISETLNECSYDMQEIMIDEIIKQIYKDHVPVKYQRTGQLLDTPQMVDINESSVTMEFLDNGDWRSVFAPYEHMNAFEMWEKGQVWGSGTNPSKDKFKFRPATKIHEVSSKRCEDEIPKKFKNYLINKGITVE